MIMRGEEIFVGMRVVCARPFAGYRTLVGETGVVVSIAGGSVGVEFDTPFPGGHDCCGRAREGHGRYGAPGCLEECVENVEETGFDIQIKFEDLFDVKREGLNEI